MQMEVTAIFDEYNKAKSRKDTIGEKGLTEQSRINARFYSGNQWYGVNGGNDRPLVRYNVIKRIGDFKMSQIMEDGYQVEFLCLSPTDRENDAVAYKRIKEKVKNGGFSGGVTSGELYALCRAASGHYRLTAERTDLGSLTARVLRNAYISGAGVLYTYFDSEQYAGAGFEGNAIKGDIKCEVIDTDDVFFADVSKTDIQEQPYIILACLKDKGELLSEAEKYGTASTVQNAEADENGKVLTITKLFKVKAGGTTSVKCITVTEKGVLRPEFDTRLHLYPLSVFRFGDGENNAYGESEITYLIPNQIAINRMITASVWSNIAAGMPMMLVNGDTVTGEITNDPGQIIKIYGTGEDVASAVKFVCPPDFSAGQTRSVNDLIYNTLTQSGAGPAALGDEQANNASAIEKLQSAAVIPLNVLKSRYREFLRQNALIWADFWFNLYSRRLIKTDDGDGVWYFPFDASRYRQAALTVEVRQTPAQRITTKEKIDLLGSLFDRGVISRRQYLARLPENLIDSPLELIGEQKEDKDDDK